MNQNRLLSIQEKRQYLCCAINSQSGENNKSDDDDGEQQQNKNHEDRYLEFKKLNDMKHSFLSIESEDELLNNFSCQQTGPIIAQQPGTSMQVIGLMRTVSINLDSSRFISYKTDNGVSNEYLTETDSRTTYRNSLSPQKDQFKQSYTNPLSTNPQIMKPKMMEKKEEDKEMEESNKKQITTPHINLNNDEREQESPLSLKKQLMRPKSNSNLLIRRKLQVLKSESSTPQQQQQHLEQDSQSNILKVQFLMNSNSNLYLTGSEVGSCDTGYSAQNISIKNNQIIQNQNDDGTSKHLIELNEDEINNQAFSLQQGAFNRAKSHTSSFMLNTKLKSKNLQMQSKLKKDYLNFLTFRPPFWENIAINFFKQKFTEYKTNKIQFRPTIVFTNISNSYSVAKIFRQKLRNPSLNLYLEVSSPFLYFDSSSIKEGETKFKNEPAIYDKLNKKLLLSELEIDSVIDCVGSNHFYVPPKYKPPDFTRAFNGLTSIGANLYSVWTLSWINLKRKFRLESNTNGQVKSMQSNNNQLNQDNTNDQLKQVNQESETEEEKQDQPVSSSHVLYSDLHTENITDNTLGEITKSSFKNNNMAKEVESQEIRIEKKILQISKLLSMNPAKILGISDQKGQIKVGLDADFVVWDPFAQTRFNVEDYQQNMDIPPLHIFDRKNFYGKIHATIIRGNILYSFQQSGENQQQTYTSSNIINDKSSERFSPFFKRNYKDNNNSHKFLDKQNFQAKLITKN